ncbi:MAG: condensation domain-containing protein, partial [Chloroflexota bacterium]|nr:condensation domain-containing protein [Chloroflexota bacterium]
FIGDAFSGWLFGSELLQVYDAMMEERAPQLPALRSTFREYVSLALTREDDVDAETGAFWQEMFGTPYDPPTGWYRARESSTDGKAWFHDGIELDAEQFAALKKHAAGQGQSAHGILLTLFYRRLRVLTGQSDLVVGTAVAGRDYPLPDLMKIFGSFATILPVRISLDDHDSLLRQSSIVGDLFDKARAHKRAPRQIARLADAGVPLTALNGLQFLFSFMDFEKIHEPQSDYLDVRWDLSQTEMQPPRLGTDLVLSGRALAGNLRLSFTAGAHAMDKEQLAALTAAFQAELQALLRPERRDGPDNVLSDTRLDAALVAYLPSKAEVTALIGELGIPATPESVRSLLFPEGQPRLLESVRISLGQSGTVCIPRFADELDRLPASTLAADIVGAGKIAGAAGARCISLAGMLPSKTRYGYAILEAMEKQPSLTVTTGHSLTAVSVVKTTQHAIQATGNRQQTLSMAFLGLGSVGGSALALYLSVYDHPARILLCDIVASEARLRSLVEEIRAELGYGGEVEIILSDGLTPPEVYAADIIVGASSQPNILDVKTLRPGTVVVDDSFPNCFDRSAAIARMEREADVLLVGAGLLDCGPVERTLHLPPGIPPEAYRVLNYFPSVGSPGCLVESLLQVRNPGLPPTHGLVTLDSARQYWQAAEALKLRAAPLHLGTYLAEADLVERLKRIRRETGPRSQRPRTF